MIQKIKSNEYLRRIDNMSVAEKESYLRRVGEWLEKKAPLLLPRTGDDAARFQNAVQCSAVWNDAECKAWNDGAVLMTALMSTADTWLPDLLYAKAARRAVRQMVAVLNSALRATSGKAVAPEGGPAMEPHAAGRGGTRAAERPGGRPQGGKAVPVRPKHIDQYVHLLPQKTQEKAATVSGLLRELDVARENARMLMESGAAADQTGAWSRTAARLDERIRAIYDELDAEWERLVKTGAVTVDDFGNAHVVESEEAKSERFDTAQKLTSEQKARRRELRKWLTDTRRGNGDTREEHLAKWSENFKEYLTLEPKDKALADQKIVAAMKHYGIELNSEQA